MAKTKPGMTPAISSAPIEESVRMPKITITAEGGIITASVPAMAMEAEASRLS